MSQMSDAYAEGYDAALQQNYNNPYLLFSWRAWQWGLGNFHGHQILCATLEHILYTGD